MSLSSNGNRNNTLDSPGRTVRHPRSGIMSHLSILALVLSAAIPGSSEDPWPHGVGSRDQLTSHDCDSVGQGSAARTFAAWHRAKARAFCTKSPVLKRSLLPVAAPCCAVRAVSTTRQQGPRWRRRNSPARGCHARRGPPHYVRTCQPQMLPQ